ncbi:MAG: hypothetical protein JSV00_06445 [bacterium]|nr:MAG: hypothetical protein JSV00_06445 [bacterium]
MNGKRLLALVCVVLAVAILALGPSGAWAQGASQGQVRKMSITGQVARAEHGYIIRGKTPAEIFTILNADPKALDGLVQIGKGVVIEVRIVSGDNVEIEKIDSNPYPPAGKGAPGPERKAVDLSVREMVVTGQIGKVPNGYVVRGTAQAVILTVLNPVPEVLDGLAESGKTVVVAVRIVSGDNVNIEKIDDKPYPGK